MNAPRLGQTNDSRSTEIAPSSSIPFTSVFAEATTYDSNVPRERVAVGFDLSDLKVPIRLPLQQGRSEWHCAIQPTPRGGEAQNDNVVDLLLAFSLVQGSIENGNVGFSLSIGDWSRDSYLVLPGSLYAGNRFESRPQPYVPTLSNSADLGPQSPTIFNDCLRLEVNSENSQFQMLGGELAIPAAALCMPSSGRGLIVMVDIGDAFNARGIEVEESSHPSRLFIRFTAPGVRGPKKYKGCSRDVVSTDLGRSFIVGDKVRLRLRLIHLPTADVFAIFDCLRKNRSAMSTPLAPNDQISFSRMFDLIEKKYACSNWDEAAGCWRVGLTEEMSQFWQTGWVGGLISHYPLYLDGSLLSRARSLRNFDFIFPCGQADSGLLYSFSDGRRFVPDGNFMPATPRAHLIRRSGDALYFSIKLLMALDDADDEMPKEIWTDGLRKLADALVKIWDRHGQFGQYVNVDTLEIDIGNSTSGGIVPAGLILAWKYFGNADYRRVAEQSARAMHDRFLAAGFTTGGPGDCLQAPDSESAFGLLESMVTLLEETGDVSTWLLMARHAADQAISWCVSYDLPFPAHSEFGRLNMRSGGAVSANAQNKHGAPGICTLSGAVLLKLFRATGEKAYLTVLQSVARAIGQCVSREDRPIACPEGRAMPPGWMNERIQIGDTCEQAGEIFYGSCWSEVSGLLTFTELPGVYLRVDEAFVFPLDHVEASNVRRTESGIAFSLRNLTGECARVRLLAEDGAEAARPLGQNFAQKLPLINLAAGENVGVTIAGGAGRRSIELARTL